MQSARLFILIATCLFLISAHDSFADDNLDITVGLGYDKMTQGYYLSLIDTLTLDEDSILTLKQDSDELNAYRLRAAIEWSKSSDAGNSLRIGNSFTGSGDDLRNSLEATCKYRSLEIRNKLDARAVLDANSSSRNGYVSNVAVFRFKPELSDGLFFVARDAFEIVRYDGSGEFIFDYNYNKFSVGFERQFGWTDMFSVTYRNDIRSVRDSTRLDLTRHRFRMQLDWSPTFSTTIRLDNELSRILAEKEGDLDDSWEDYLEIELYAIFSESWRASLRNQFEYVTYDTQDVVNFDYLYNTSEFTLTRSVSDELQIFAKPSLAIFWSRRSDFEQQDYLQSDVEYGFDLSVGTGLWLSASHRIGSRNYTNESNMFYTDYMLNQLNLLGDIRIYDGIRFSVLISTDWETHDLDENDNSLSLISIGLDYRL